MNLQSGENPATLLVGACSRPERHDPWTYLTVTSPDIMGSTSIPSGVVDDPLDCLAESSVLETMDACISCVEGIEVQRAFDDEWTAVLHPVIDLDNDATPDSAVETTTGELYFSGERSSKNETVETATLIRLQLMEEKASSGRGVVGAPVESANDLLSDFDLLHNLCGSDGDEGAEEKDEFEPNKSMRIESSPTAEESPALALPMCVSPSPCRFDKPVDTTIDTAQTVDIDDSFLSMVTEEDDRERETEADAPVLRCAVCFVEAFERDVTIVATPCCSHQMCGSCIVALTLPARHDVCRVGRCPCCRSWIVVESPDSTDPATARPTTSLTSVVPTKPLVHLHLVSAAGKCQACRQIKHLLVDGSSICDVCFISRSYPPLYYQCDCCQHTQRIDHPLYRYQSTPASFGSEGWLCAACNEFARWRIRPDQVPFVPLGDAPPGWDEDAMEKARARVQRACVAEKNLQVMPPPSWDRASYLRELGDSSNSCAIF